MEYNSKEILSIFDNLKDMTHLNIEDVESGCLDFLYNHFSFEYYYGASKVVIIPSKESDYVIKIPFNEYSNETDDSYGCVYYDSTPLINANRNRIHYWDYCFNELYRYHIAKQNNYEQFFAKVKLIGQVGKFPIYAQQRVDANKNNYKTLPLDKYHTILNSIKKQGVCPRIDINWLGSIEEIYGTEYMLKFVDFLHEQKWDDDLTSYNVGYTFQDEPIIFDFAGFED